MRRLVALAASAGLVVAGCASSPVTQTEMSTAGVMCRNGGLTIPGQRVEVTFEVATHCPVMAGAYAGLLLGKPLDEKNADFAGAVQWMNSELEPRDSVMIDRFGRAHLQRCSSDPELATPSIEPAPKIGDGKRELYVLIELPQSNAACQKPGS